MKLANLTHRPEILQIAHRVQLSPEFIPHSPGHPDNKFIGLHTDGHYITQRQSGYINDKYNVQSIVNERAVEFNYWRINNTYKGPESNWIWPARDPDSGHKPIITTTTTPTGEVRKCITNHNIFFSCESICHLNKYGIWPVDQEITHKDNVKIIKVMTLSRLPVLVTGTRDTWKYDYSPLEVAIYTGELTGPTKNYTIEGELTQAQLNKYADNLTAKRKALLKQKSLNQSTVLLNWEGEKVTVFNAESGPVVWAYTSRDKLREELNNPTISPERHKSIVDAFLYEQKLYDKGIFTKDAFLPQVYLLENIITGLIAVETADIKRDKWPAEVS